jgi:pimeloyl-ACP methyl ester carboxylesterase
VAIDPFPRQPWIANLLRIPGLGERLYWFVFGNPKGRWVTSQILRKEREPGTDLTLGFAKADPKIVMHYLVLMMDVAEIRMFAGLKTPIDLAYGEHTFKAVRKGLPEWEALFPNIRFHRLTGAGHEPLREATGQVARVVFGREPGSGPI